ncbi:hypothetical protein [Mycobacterium syngnathidarum]
MKVRIKIRPRGYFSVDAGPLREWPPVGTVVDLPDATAQPMIDAGTLERVHLGKATPPAAKPKPAPKQQPHCRNSNAL